jgi:hypothetical protein
MDTILMTVTVLSLAMVAGMGALLARMLRDERRRSDARVELLTQLATEGAPRRVRPETSPVAELELRPTAPVSVPVSDLFHEHERPNTFPRRLAVAGAMAAVVGIVVIGWNFSAAKAPIPAHSVASTAAPQPLELLSLGHTAEAGSLIVSGLVQNPRGAAPLTRVRATLVVFGTDGALQTTAAAPLDFTTLGPGDESPFVIRVAVAAPPARYRIGFRGENDRALGHIDRRPDAVARKQTP